MVLQWIKDLFTKLFEKNNIKLKGIIDSPLTIIELTLVK